MSGFPDTIEIGGVTYPVTAPDYATRDDMAAAFHGISFARISFVCAAALALCCPAITPKATYDGDSLEMWRFGREVYNKLAGRFSNDDIQSAGIKLIKAAGSDRFPAEDEVTARADFSGAQAGRTS